MLGEVRLHMWNVKIILTFWGSLKLGSWPPSFSERLLYYITMEMTLFISDFLQGLRYRNEASHIARAGTSATSSSLGGEAGAGAGEVPNPGITSPWPRSSVAGAPTRNQRLLHGLLSVGVQWGFARLRRHGLMHGWAGGEAVSEI